LPAALLPHWNLGPMTRRLALAQFCPRAAMVPKNPAMRPILPVASKITRASRSGSVDLAQGCRRSCQRGARTATSTSNERPFAS
jgi:hypothetical protein